MRMSTTCCCISIRRRSATSTARRCARCSRGAGARRRPLGAIGSVARTDRRSRRQRRAVHWDMLRQDLRYTARMLRRAPGFAVTAIADRRARHRRDDGGVLGHRLRAAPAAAVSRRRSAGASSGSGRQATARLELSAANYRDWKQGSTVFETHRRRITAPPRNLIGAGEPLRVEGAAVSADLLPTLGVQPLHRPAVRRRPTIATGAAGTVILSYRLWQTQFGGDPGVVGRAGAARRRAVHRHRRHAAGVPVSVERGAVLDADCASTSRTTSDRNDNWLDAVGRLRAGVTLEQARAEMSVRRGAVAAAVSRRRTRTSAPSVSELQRRGARSSRGCC